MDFNSRFLPTLNDFTMLCYRLSFCVCIKAIISNELSVDSFLVYKCLKVKRLIELLNIIFVIYLEEQVLKMNVTICDVYDKLLF